MLASKFGHWIGGSIIHHFLALLHFGLSLLLDRNRLLNGLPNGQFAGTLANLGDVSAGKAHGHFGQISELNIGRNWRFAKRGFEDGQTARLIRQWDVDELVEAAWTQNCGVNDVRAEFLFVFI